MAAENDNAPDALLPDLEDTAELPALSEPAVERLIATDSWQVSAAVRAAAETAARPELAELRARCAQYLELLEDLEGRRVLLEGLIGEYEQRLEERAQHVESLERRFIEQARELRRARARLARLEPPRRAARTRWLWPRLSALRPLAPSSAAGPGSVTESGPCNALPAPPQLESGAAVPEPVAMPEPAAGSEAGEQGAAPVPVAALVPIEGAGHMVRLGTRTTIGRLPGNDVCIAAEVVSRHHAVVLANGERVVLEDLHSTNGTFVNGARVARCTLNDGDLLTIGRTRLRYVMHAPPA